MKWASNLEELYMESTRSRLRDFAISEIGFRLLP